MRFTTLAKKLVRAAAYTHDERNRQPDNEDFLQPDDRDVHRRDAIEEVLGDQPGMMIFMLMAVAHIGSGDLIVDGSSGATRFQTGDLLRFYGFIQGSFGEARWAINKMIEKAALHRHIAVGMQRLSAAGIDIDALMLTPQVSRPITGSELATAF